VVSLVLTASDPAWFLQVDLENIGDVAATLDLIYAQDLALAHYSAVRLDHPEATFTAWMGGRLNWRWQVVRSR
jgi:hypothetical protein